MLSIASKITVKVRYDFMCLHVHWSVYLAFRDVLENGTCFQTQALNTERLIEMTDREVIN